MKRLARKPHWRARFDFDADFVLCRTMRLGEGDDPFIRAGSDLPDEIKQRLGRNRMKMWFESGFVALKDWQDAEPMRHERLALREKRDAELAASLQPREGLRAEVEAAAEEPKKAPKKKAKKSGKKSASKNRRRST